MQEDHELVWMVKQALQRLRLSPEVTGMQGWTDAATLFHKGVPALLLGPESIEQVHTNDEYVEVSQLVNAVKSYLSIIETICGWR